VTSCKQLVDEKRPTPQVSQTRPNSINIQDVLHVTMVTNVEPLLIGALLKLANSC